jgi:hypothetical protein
MDFLSDLRGNLQFEQLNLCPPEIPAGEAICTGHVYGVTHNGQLIYIGSSAMALEARMRAYVSSLRCNTTTRPRQLAVAIRQAPKLALVACAVRPRQLAVAELVVLPLALPAGAVMIRQLALAMLLGVLELALVALAIPRDLTVAIEQSVHELTLVALVVRIRPLTVTMLLAVLKLDRGRVLY